MLKRLAEMVNNEQSAEIIGNRSPAPSGQRGV